MRLPFVPPALGRFASKNAPIHEHHIDDVLLSRVVCRSDKRVCILGQRSRPVYDGTGARVDLLDARIPQKEVGAISVVSHVLSEHSSDAVYVLDETGRRWVSKIPAANELLAEALGWLLSRALNVPTPDAAYAGVGNERAWLSEQVNPANHWSKSRAHRLANPEGLGAMVALDAIIGNFDRHAGNILVQPRANPANLVIFSIDLGNSWLGSPYDLEEQKLSPPPISNLAPGIPIDMIDDFARTTADLAAQLPGGTLARYVREACYIAREPQEDRLLQALTRRCKAAPQITAEYLDSIRERP